MKIIKVSDNVSRDLIILKAQLKHKTLNDTISYLLYELNKEVNKNDKSDK